MKGYEAYVVQDLVMESKNTLYLRARYELPDGSSILAPLPADVIPGKHFGATLIGYILHQYHNAGVTQGLLLQSLHDYGVDISEGRTQSPPDGEPGHFPSGERRSARSGATDGIVHRHG